MKTTRRTLFAENTQLRAQLAATETPTETRAKIKVERNDLRKVVESQSTKIAGLILERNSLQAQLAKAQSAKAE